MRLFRLADPKDTATAWSLADPRSSVGQAPASVPVDIAGGRRDSHLTFSLMKAAVALARMTGFGNLRCKPEGSNPHATRRSEGARNFNAWPAAVIPGNDRFLPCRFDQIAAPDQPRTGSRLGNERVQHVTRNRLVGAIDRFRERTVALPG